MKNDERWTRGQLAKLANVNLETVRFYEQKGLLPKPERTPAGYRLYKRDQLLRLKFIQKAQTLGFTLNEIKQLLFLRASNRSSKQVKQLAADKIADVQLKIQSLQRMLKTLRQISSACDGRGTVDACPILKALESNETSLTQNGDCHESH